MSKTLVAFHGDATLKTRLLKELALHRKQDQIVQGTYGQGSNGDWKGCAVGCGVHSLNRIKKTDTEYSDHGWYAKQLGFDEKLAHLEDAIFEGLDSEQSKDWPQRFTKAIPVGADLSGVVPRFIVWLMEDQKQYAKDYPNVLAALGQVQGLYQRIVDGGTVSDSEWESVAESVARSAWSAESVARSAWSAWSAAESAAWSAAWSAESAVWSAAWSAARSAAYAKMADKLIGLLKSAPITNS